MFELLLRNLIVLPVGWRVGSLPVLRRKDEGMKMDDAIRFLIRLFLSTFVKFRRSRSRESAAKKISERIRPVRNKSDVTSEVSIIPPQLSSFGDAAELSPPAALPVAR